MHDPLQKHWLHQIPARKKVTEESKLEALKEKGLVKIRNFKKNPKKINYVYVLTPKGIAIKTKLTLNFMKRKMVEYDQLKKELNKKK